MEIEKLKVLNKKYGPELAYWLTKFSETHKMYQIMSNAYGMLIGKIAPSKKYKISSLEKFLFKIFGDDEIIEIDDSDEDDKTKIMLDKSIQKEIEKEIFPLLDESYPLSDESHPSGSEKNSVQVKTKETIKERRKSICIPSINQYTIKTQKLVPASAYAKRNENERKIISCKSEVAMKKVRTAYDPVKEAVKLNNIKEKIYLKNFLKIDHEKLDIDKALESSLKEKDEITKKRKSRNSVDVTTSGGYTSDNETLQKGQKKNKLRERSKSLFYDIQDLQDINPVLQSIPINKSARAVKKGRKKKSDIDKY